MTPVMYSDISGYMMQLNIEYIDNYFVWLKEGYKSIWKSLNDEFVIDTSYSIPINFLGPYSVKIGISYIANLDQKYIEFYPHLGIFLGYSKGFSGSIGVLENYDNPGDYKSHFIYGEAAFFIGGGHCFDPTTNYEDAVKSYYIEFTKGFSSLYGYDYYYWNEHHIFDWGK